MGSGLTDRLLRLGVARVLAAALTSMPAWVGLLAVAPTQAAPAAVGAPADVAAQKKLLAANGLFNRQMFDLAAPDFEQFLEQFPTHPEATNARFALGICQYNLAKYDKAIEQLTKVGADEKFAQRDEAIAYSGYAYLTLKKYDLAVAAFDQISAKFPQSKHAEGAALNKARALYLQGVALSEKPAGAAEARSKHTAAIAAAQAFLQQYPKSPERLTAAFFLGLSQKSVDQNDAAAATLAGLLKEDPKCRYALDATLVLGQALEAQGKLDEAAERFRQMVAAAPALRLPEAHYCLGSVLYRRAKYDEAAREFAATIESGPETPYAMPARLQLGLAQLAAGRIIDSRKALLAIVKDDPANAAAARYGLTQCDISDKKFDSALATLEELLKLQPPPVNAQQISFDRALCLAELGRHEESAKAFEAFIAANPKSPLIAEAGYRQSFSLHKLARYDASHALCEKLAKAGAGEFAAPLQDLDAENLFLLGKYEEAAKVFAALSAADKREDVKDRLSLRLGQCAYSLGDFSKAVEILQPLAQKPKVAADESLGRALFLLGDSLRLQKKYAEAADALQKYIANLKPTVDKLDKQEAQYKQAYSLLRAAAEGTAPPASARRLLAAVAAGAETSAWTTRANFELGQIAYQTKPPQLDEAAACFKKVMAANAGSPPEELGGPSLYYLGWIDFDQKKYDSAAASWADVLKRFGKTSVAPDAAFHCGVALREAGQFGPALEALRNYEKAYPKGAHATRARQLAAACLASLDRHAEAKALLAALADDKATVNDAVLYDLAWSQKHTKDPAGATASYRRLIKEFPEARLTHAARAELAQLLVEENKHAEAVALLEPVIAAKDVEPGTRSLAMALLGVAYKGAGKPEKATEAFAAYAKAYPDDKFSGDALLQAGEGAASFGRYSDAERAFSELLTRFPKHPQAALAQLKLGEAQADGGRFSEALASHQAFLSRYPKDPLAFRAQFGVGWALQNLRKLEQARDAYGKVIASNNGETAARAQFQIGETFCEEGKFEQAVPALLAVEDVYAYPKWSARALLTAGKAFEQLKKPDLARKQYETILGKYKDMSDEVKLAEVRLKELK